MDREQLVQKWKKEEEKPFTGWDFSYLKDRIIDEKPDWSYEDMAKVYLQGASSVLDIGTGGGERLLELLENYSNRAKATEGYLPNLGLARQNLERYGIEVHEVDTSESSVFPFEDGEFDLVLSRHSAYNASEVYRVLSNGGKFLSQQVHGKSGEDLMALFGQKSQWPYFTTEYAHQKLEDAGFEVKSREWQGRKHVFDVGALVYYLKAVPWTVPDFSVDRYLKVLLELHQRILEEKSVSFSIAYMFLDTRK